MRFSANSAISAVEGGPKHVMDELRAAGVSLRVDGDRLVVHPRAAVTDELCTLIRNNRVDLMDELRDDAGIEAIRRVFGIEPPKAAPVLVRCCACASFIADAIGDGLGIGRCAVDGEGSRPHGRWKVRPALWARGERRCGDYRGVAI